MYTNEITGLFQIMMMMMIIGASLSEHHTYRTAEQNPPDIYYGSNVSYVS